MGQNISSIVLVFFLFSTGFFNTDCQLSARQISEREADPLKGTILTSNGKPAKNAIVSGSIRQHQSVPLINVLPTENTPTFSIATPMNTMPEDENGRTIKLGSAIDGGRFFAADDKGQFECPASLTSFFIQSADGTEAAFVPPGFKFPIRLKKCASLKINNSILAKEKAAFGKGSVTVVWKNCLAGAYPLLYAPKSNSDLPPRDWKIYPYFSILTQVDDVDLSSEFEFELRLPPGEVSISVLTDKQREHLETYQPKILKSRRHFPSTCGIVSLTSGNKTEVPLQLGTCIRGRIIEKEKAASPLPNWSPGARAYSMRFRGAEEANVAYWKSKNRKPTYEDKYREYQKSVPQIVNELTSMPDGFKFRIQTHAGVIAAMFDSDGNFTSVPLPNGSYYGDLTSFDRTRVKQSNATDEEIKIPPGYKVVSVKVSLDEWDELIKNGDHVDAIAISGDGESTENETTILSYVRVFNVASNRQIAGLLVTAAQADEIVEARKRGTLRLAKRDEKFAVATAPSNSNGAGPKKCILVSPLFSASSEERASSAELQQEAAAFTGGFMAIRTVDGNAVLKTIPNVPFFNAGEFVAVAADGASKDELQKDKLKSRLTVDSESDTGLRAAIAKEFDLKMSARLDELDDLELLLKAARKKLQLRQRRRNSIIERRLKELGSEQLKKEDSTTNPADKVSVARMEIKNLAQTFTAYLLQVGQYPESLEDLVSRPAKFTLAEWGGPYLENSVLNDPWKRPYKLIVDTAKGQRTIISVGPDGKAGTNDDVTSQLSR